MTQFQEAGLEERLKEQSLLVREERVLDSIPERLAPFRRCLETLKEELPIDRTFLSDKALEDLPGKTSRRFAPPGRATSARWKRSCRRTWSSSGGRRTPSSKPSRSLPPEGAGRPKGCSVNLLQADLRCLDAYAHLGNFQFEREWPELVERAERHYRVGVAIGELSLPGPVLEFGGLLPRGLIDNRPFLRCLHGLGLTRWRKGDAETAERIFRRLVWLDPRDGLGARFLVDQVRSGQSREELY